MSCGYSLYIRLANYLKEGNFFLLVLALQVFAVVVLFFFPIVF